MSKPLRYIIVGTGGFGGHWCRDVLPRLAGMQKAVPAAAVDIKSDALKNAREFLGLPANRCYTDIAEAFDRNEADFGIVVVPPAHHEAIVDVILAHDMHVLSEKPIADTMEGCVRIYRKVKAAGKKMAVTMSHRFDQDKQTLERLIKSGEYGKVDYIIGRNTWAMREFPTWGAFRYRIPDTLLVEGTVHHFDIMRALAASDARTVYAKTWNPEWSDFEGDCQALITIEMENGVKVFYEGAKANASSLNAWGRDYWRAECDRATLELDNRTLRVVTGALHHSATIEEKPLEQQPVWTNPWIAEMFCDWLSGGEAPPTHLDDNIQCAALLFAAIESAHTGRPVDVQEFLKKHLGVMTIRVTADVAFANVCDVEVAESEDVTEVSFAADPHGGPECLWFCFRIERQGRSPAGRKLKLVLKHSWSMLGITLPYGVRPVVREAKGDWERLGEPWVEELPDGRRLVWWTTRTPRTFVDVALSYPYGPDDLELLLRETGSFWRADTLGVSQGARPIVRLSNDHGEADGKRPGIYLVARQHSGEVPGSWVLDGFLREMASAGDDAPLVWAVPFANIDGVMQGDYGKDNFPYDLNRAWGSPAMRHETLVMQRDVAAWRKRCRPMLGIDLHGPGGAETDGVYCYLPDPKELPEIRRAVTPWTADIREALTPLYAAEQFDRVADYASRWETPSFGRFFWQTLGLPAVCVETPYGMSRELVLTREHYREIGKRMAQGVLRRLSGDVRRTS